MKEQEIVTRIMAAAAEATAALTKLVEEHKAVAHALAGCGADSHLSLAAQVGWLCAELKGWRSGAAEATKTHERSMREILRAAVASGKVTISKGAAAGLREMLTGESGAVEIELGEQEIVDLALCGKAFTEVGGADNQPDTLVLLRDTTGLLRHLQPHVGHVTGQAEGEGGEGESGGGMTH